MEVGGKPGIGEQIAGALDWWRDAGVDLDYSDQAVNWLAKAAPASESIAGEAQHVNAAPKDFERHEGRDRRLSREAPVPEIDLSELPQDLPAFSAWWLSEPSLDGGIVSRRVPPRGSASPELMVIVTEPEEQDSDTLLSGPHGQLLSGILAASGVAEDKVYVAAALPRQMPLPDWAALRSAGLGQVLSHHVELVAPARILLFGSHILSLLGHDWARKPVFLPSVNHAGPGYPLLVELDLAALLARPRSKAGLWNRLLDWMGN
jgi:uracil-DNA glycosylase